MMVLRRAPREVYRVYSEEEFFDGAADMAPFTPTNSSGAGERRLRRLAGAAMLAGAMGTMGGAVLLAGSRPTRGPDRRAGNGAAQALARGRLLARVGAQLRTPAAGGSDVALYPSAAGRARSIARAAAPLALTAEPASHPRIAREARAEHAEQREEHGGDARVSVGTLPVDTASGSAPVPAASDGASIPVSAAASSDSPSTTATTPPPPAPSAERAEFGFER